MKTKMKFLKALSFVLCLLMLLPFSAFAQSEASVENSKHVPVDWVIDESLEYVWGGEKRYDRYYSSVYFYDDADSLFYFYNVINDGDIFYEVYGDSAYPHIVTVSGYGKMGYSYVYTFVDDEGRKMLDSFLDKTDCIYFLESFDVSYSPIDEELVEYLDAEYAKNDAELKSVDVRELGEAKIYEITVHDKTITKAYQQGAVYVMPNGSYYYVCFEDLPNNYFNADGYFSYRSGNVDVYEITDRDRIKSINSYLDGMSEKPYNHIYEMDVIKGYYDVNGNPIENSYDLGELDLDIVFVVLFLVVNGLVGIVVPSVFLALGIRLARSKKTGKAKSWYLMSAFAAVWIFSSLLLLILVLI